MVSFEKLKGSHFDSGPYSFDLRVAKCEVNVSTCGTNFWHIHSHTSMVLLRTPFGCFQSSFMLAFRSIPPIVMAP